MLSSDSFDSEFVKFAKLSEQLLKKHVWTIAYAWKISQVYMFFFVEQIRYITFVSTILFILESEWQPSNVFDILG